jgi:chromosome partitioning protein
VTRSVYDAIVDPTVALKDVIVKAPVPNLWIAPSRIALAKLESQLIGEVDAHFRLKDRLDAARAEFEYVVIDCPPTLGLLTVNALVASSHLLIPIQSSYFALEGTDDLLETVDKVRLRANPSLQIVGVVITMHDRRTALGKDIKRQIHKVFGPKVFRTLISKSVRLEESPAYKESIFSFAPDSSGATDYDSLYEEVIEPDETRLANHRPHAPRRALRRSSRGVGFVPDRSAAPHRSARSESEPAATGHG